LIARGLRARLGLQSLITGQLQVEIDFFPDSPITLVGYNPEYLEIPTIPTPIEALAKKLEKFPIEETIEKLVKSIDGLEKLTTSEELHASVTDLSASIKSLRNTMQAIEAKTAPLLTNLERAVTSTNTMVGNIDNRTATLTTGIDETLTEAQELIQNIDGAIDPIASGVADAAAAATASLEQARRSLIALEAFTDGETVLSHSINQSFVELADAIRNIRTLTDYLERHPEALLRGKSQPGGE
jgi:paraquat-inducible protein B